MALVPDPSAIISLAFDDEDAVYAEAVERRKRTTIDQTAAFLADLNLLLFEVDYQPSETKVLELARRYTRTVYDAAYLELAQRKTLPLATVDRALIRAAEASGLPLWKY